MTIKQVSCLGYKMTDLRQILASNMKNYRKSLGISQAKLAEMAGTTNNYIGLIEIGKRFPTVKMLERIAKALQKDTLDLFSITPANLEKSKKLKSAIMLDIDAILTARLNE